EKLDIRRDTSRNPLFDVMFNMVDTASSNNIKLKNMSLIPYDNENKVSKFDLTLNALESDGKLSFNIYYCSKLFKKETIERLSIYYVRILDSIVNNVEIKLNEIHLLKEAERNQILYEFNDTKSDYSRDKTIHEIFETQVEKTPDNIAIVFEGKKLTYRELNEKSNSIARVLRDEGIKADSIVGIMVERSLEMIIGIMAILKAGGAYLPIDTKLPKHRIEYILKDSGTKILLTKIELVEAVRFDGIVIDLFKEDLFKEDFSNLKKINNSNNLAYVIYTSGTTGDPKGVMIEHKSLNNLILGLNRKIYKKYNRHLNICLVAPYYFDASVKQIFAAILNGHSLYITDDYTRRDAKKLIHYYGENSIDISDGTPMHLKMMISSELLKTSNIKVEQYIIGGEELNLNTVREFYKNLKEEKKPYINNVYGPTECCVDSSIYAINTKEINNIEHIPIGKSMVNYKLYIVDKNNCLQPIGVPGEICISGEGLARGYLNNAELTREKFVDNPFETGTKMYKTGDLAKWLSDGNIEFLGRIDSQVKIRGFRIELGEIESKILQHEDVKEAAVIVIGGKNDDKYICSYIVSDKEINELKLRDYLKEKLPQYMIPLYFVKLDNMPLTSNGKLDKRALPKPNVDERLTSYEAPRNDLEIAL
ncbi:amino acid adenylation domain-containing protein, partial [Clostridium felsineum]|uniref:amino acid adenylation domain-containing protein n=1 Tax=Clostridium felsineum TaxID=36839 RepID=UPI00214DC5C7